MKEMKHENIVMFIDSYLIDNHSLWIALEYVGGGIYIIFIYTCSCYCIRAIIIILELLLLLLLYLFIIYFRFIS